MKKIFLASIFVLLINSCEKKVKTDSVINKEKVNSDIKENSTEDVEDYVSKLADSIDNAANAEMSKEKPQITRAKTLIDDATYNVLQAVKGKKTKEQVNKIVDPAMKEYEVIYKSLSNSEKKELDDYRAMKAVEVVNAEMSK